MNAYEIKAGMVYLQGCGTTQIFVHLPFTFITDILIDIRNKYRCGPVYQLEFLKINNYEKIILQQKNLF